MPSKVVHKSHVSSKSRAHKRSHSNRKAMRARSTSVPLTKAPPDVSTGIRPLQMLNRVAGEVSRTLNGLARDRVPAAPELGPASPHVDVTQHNDELLIRVDLPGAEKNQIKISVADHEITVCGERRRPAGEERDGVYASERTYGTFYRAIPLPEGARADQAKASFQNGVLEIRGIQVPAAEGRPIEITE